VNDRLIVVALTYPAPHLRFYEAPSGKMINVWSNRIDAFCLSPDGEWCAVWGRRDRVVRILHVPDGQLRNAWDTGKNYVVIMAFSPDGSLLAAADNGSGAVDLYDPADGTLCGRLEGPTGRMASLAFSPDGRLLATGHYDQSIRLWDVAANGEVRRLHGHRSAAMGLAFSPDGTRLASGGYDGTVRFWDVAAPPRIPALTNVNGVFAFSADGRWLVTQHTNEQMALWELPARGKLREWPAPPCDRAVFIDRRQLLAASGGDTNSPPALHYFDLEGLAARIDLPLSGVNSACTAIALAPDGAVCVTGHQDGTVAFWEARTGRLLSAAWQAHRGTTASNTWEVLHLKFSADGQTLLSTGYDVLLVKTWSVAKRRELASRGFVNRYDPVPAIAPDGREIAIGGPGQGLTVNFWTADLKTSPRQFEGHQDYLHAIVYSPDGRTLATGGLDGLLKLWHLPTGREFGTLATFDHLVGFRELAFSPDGSWLAALVKDGTLHLWHAPGAGGPESAP